MTHEPGPGRSHDRWAHLRFAVVGPLLAAPPPPGALKAALTALAATPWRHPLTGEPTRFAFSTNERWLYQAKRERTDPVGVLRRKVRKDLGRPRVLRDALTHVLRAHYAEHPSWSAQLHADNLAVRVEADSRLGPRPSYATVRRFLRAHGLLRRRRLGPRGSPGAARAEARFERREVRSYEAAYVHGLWHLDFHHGSRPVLRADGTRVTPVLLGVLDDRTGLPLGLRAEGKALALEVLDRPAPAAAAPPSLSPAERVEQALADASAPVSLAMLRQACRIRMARLCEVVAALTAAGRVRKTAAGYELAR